MRDLNDTELLVLERLNDTGAATVADLAVRLRDLPERVEPKLKTLATMGLVETMFIAGEFGDEVYRVSEKGRRVLRLAHA